VPAYRPSHRSDSVRSEDTYESSIASYVVLFGAAALVGVTLSISFNRCLRIRFSSHEPSPGCVEKEEA
jgi:hypothetical protein